MTIIFVMQLALKPGVPKYKIYIEYPRRAAACDNLYVLD